jgi:hypothetical protein
LEDYIIDSNDLFYSAEFQSQKIVFPFKNRFLPISIPLLRGKTNFTFETDEDGCIEREFYQKELLRIFDLNINPSKFISPETLVIGSQSSIGPALIEHFKLKNISTLGLKCQYFLIIIQQFPSIY